MSAQKVVVVTGVSRGLGRAMTDHLIDAGHIVVGCARSHESVAELTTRYGDPHLFSTVDVEDAEAVERWAEAVALRHGSPDLLINNAGVINQNLPLWQVPPGEFSTVVDINIKGVFHMIRSFVPLMINRGSGVIVNFSSTWGRSTSPEVAPYCATKWAIEGLSQALADELPAGLAVVALNPGVIHTDMLEACFGAGASAYPSPADWAQRAVPFILNFGARDNGASVTAP